MKKIKTTMAALATIVLLSGCGTTGASLLGAMATGATGTTAPATTPTTTTTSAETGGLASLLGDVLGTVLSASTKLTEKDLHGTWSYQSADCVFETENLLMKAGGEVAAAQVETKLNETFAKVGIKPGTCTFTFNSDNTYSATISGYTIAGEYVLDAENKKVTMSYLSGLAVMNPNIVKSGNTLSLLFEADMLLAIAQRLAAMSNNASLQSLADLASAYDGLMIGLELSK